MSSYTTPSKTWLSHGIALCTHVSPHQLSSCGPLKARGTQGGWWHCCGSPHISAWLSDLSCPLHDTSFSSCLQNTLVLLENQPVLCENRERCDAMLSRGFSRVCLRMPQVTYSGHHFANAFSWQKPAQLPKGVLLLTRPYPSSLLLPPA